MLCCLSMVNVAMLVAIALSVIMLYLSMAKVIMLIVIVLSDVLLHLCRLQVRDNID
jgi:hypothetical protein